MASWGTITTSRQTVEEGSIHWCLSSDPSSIFCVCPSLSVPSFPLYFYFSISPPPFTLAHLLLYFPFFSQKTIYILRRLILRLASLSDWNCRCALLGPTWFSNHFLKFWWRAREMVPWVNPLLQMYEDLYPKNPHKCGWSSRPSAIVVISTERRDKTEDSWMLTSQVACNIVMTTEWPSIKSCGRMGTPTETAYLS